jgi:hypothetical protein
MSKANSVLSTPPTNTSAIDHPMMFPLVDPTRRRFLAVAAVASVVSAGTLAAATAMDPSIPQAVTVPIGPDPIFAVIERDRKACAEHIEAVRVEFAFEEAHDIEGERKEEYDRLYAATGDAWDAMDEAARNLVTTKPATLAGILALSRYIEPLFGEDDQPKLPEHIEYEDAASAYIPEAFAYVIGRAIEELMKAPAGKAVQS